METDQVSVASSLTVSSSESVNSNFSDFTQHSENTETSGSAKGFINIPAIVDSKMTDDQIKERSKADFNHKMVRLELIREAAVDKYLADRNENNNTTQKGDHSDNETISDYSDKNSTVTPKGGKTSINNSDSLYKEEHKRPASSNNAGMEECVLTSRG